jgi:hypothetical protein
VSSAPFEDDRVSPTERAAGFLAAISLTASAIALIYRPVRLAPFALLVAFIAAALAKDDHKKLAAFAVGAATIAWLVGMAIAVIWSKPIY